MAAFEEVGIMPELIRAVEDLGWNLPTPIQAESVPLILGGGDVLAAAETGSGKTGAFALPILQIVHETRRRQLRGDGGAARGGGAGDAGPSQAARLSADDRDALLAISPDGLVCQARHERLWAGCRASAGVFGARVYFEATVRDEGLCRVGWSTKAGALDLGTDKQGFGYGGTGKKSHERRFDDYGQPYGLGDTVGCALDLEAGTVSFSKNGTDLGQAFEVPKHLRGQAFYPAVVLKNAVMEFNFGAQPFRCGPPPGFVGLDAAPAAVKASEGDAAPGTAKDGRTKPLALILEPTRDLAEQTYKCILDFKTHLTAPKLSAELLVGGVDARGQLRSLAAGVDILVGTPARVIDFAESGKLAVDGIKFFVLDEADRLLDTGSRDELMKLFRMMPKSGTGQDRLQVLLFSATLHSPEIKELANVLCQNPVWVDLKGRDFVPETVDHVCVVVDPREDRSWLQAAPRTYTDNAHKHDDPPGPNSSSREAWSEAVKRLKPRVLQRLIDQHNMQQCLIFCRTNFDCDNLEKFLNELGGGRAFKGKMETGVENAYSCVVLGGARSMEERRRNLQAFKDGDVRFLICTDVAARGIDIQGLPFVINMTLPDQSEDYIHRVGRVGRADHMGLAISIVSAVEEKVWYCTKKGYKPWFDPKPADAKTHEQGGHTIWYNEPELLKACEGRVGHPIARLDEDMGLPKEIAVKMKAQGGTYGEERGSGARADVMERVERLRPVVKRLADLEVEAQHSFHNMKRRFGRAK